MALAFDDAVARVLGAARLLERESLPLRAAAGRVLREEVAADLDLPPFDTTAMDGWAVRSQDVASCPASLRALGTVAAGDEPPGELLEGCALKVMTGAPMPPGSDAVVPVEQAREPSGGRVELLEAPAAGQHVRRRGEVIAAGALLLSPGRRLSPADVALAAVAGRASLEVTVRPRAGVLVTGDEIVPAGSPLRHGQIRNSNGPMLVAALERLGADVTDLGAVSDERQALRAALAAALDGSFDLLITSGGVSAGDFDLVRPVLEELGARVLFHKVSMKPAKPILVAEAGRTLVFGLPGNPVSSAVAGDLLVRPAVRAMLGLEPSLPPPVTVVLVAAVRNKGPRLGFHPARVRPCEGRLTAEPLATRGSHDILSHARAGALLRLPPEAELAAGDAVPAYLAAEDTVMSGS